MSNSIRPRVLYVCVNRPASIEEVMVSSSRGRTNQDPTPSARDQAKYPFCKRKSARRNLADLEPLRARVGEGCRASYLAHAPIDTDASAGETAAAGAL
jgi:hypothetical protein